MTNLFQIHRYSTLDSTQDELWRLAEKGAPAGTVVLAQQQTAGRGRRGDRWESPEGGLYLSLLLVKTEPLGLLPLAVGFAAAGALTEFQVEPKLGWPNDLLLDGKKLGGILCECRKEQVAVGVGINTGGLPTVPDRPVVALNSPRKREEILQGVLEQIGIVWASLQSGEVHSVVKAVESILLGRGEDATISTPTGKVSGRIIGINHEGALLLEGQAPIHSGSIVRIKNVVLR